MHLLRLLLAGATNRHKGRVAVRVEAHHDFEHALAETKLPERPDYEAANGFVVKARLCSARGSLARVADAR